MIWKSMETRPEFVHPSKYWSTWQTNSSLHFREGRHTCKTFHSGTTYVGESMCTGSKVTEIQNLGIRHSLQCESIEMR